jgi:hypothetical protein
MPYDADKNGLRPPHKPETAEMSRAPSARCSGRCASTGNAILVAGDLTRLP